MELIHTGCVIKKDTGNLIRSYNIFKDGEYLQWELTQGKMALFDVEDFDTLIKKEWRAARSKRSFYAASGREQLVFAHNYLFKTECGITVDHKNMNGLDNRRENLRLATTTQQMLNRRREDRCFRGVVWNDKVYKWRSEGRCDNEHFHVGYFQTEVDAAIAWDEYMFEKYKNHNPLEGVERNGITGEPTLNFIHFNFPERLGL